MLPEKLEPGMTVEWTNGSGTIYSGLFAYMDSEGWSFIVEMNKEHPSFFRVQPAFALRPVGWASHYVAALSEILDKRSKALIEADRKVLALTRDKERLERALGAKFVDTLALESTETLYQDALRLLQVAMHDMRSAEQFEQIKMVLRDKHKVSL